MGDQPPDILKKEGLWLLCLNDPGDIVKQRTTRVIKASLFSSLAERLTRKPCAYDVASSDTFRNMLAPFRLIKVSTGGLGHLSDVVRKTPGTRKLVIMSHKEIGG